MKRQPITLEQTLLSASGLIAIGTVVVISYSYGRHEWQNLVVQLGFAAAFLTASNDEEMGLRPVYGRAAVLLMLALSVISLVLYPDTLTLILAVVLMASAPYHLSRGQSWLLLGLANLLYWTVLSSRFNADEYLAGWLTLVALQGFAVTSSQARQRDLASQRALERQNNELLAARAVMARQSQAQERLRIAGELHDTIGHGLTALQLQLEALMHESPEALRPRLAPCKKVAADLLEEVRTIVRDMQSRGSNDLAATLQELEALTPGIDIRLNAELPQFSPVLSQQLVFCFQEAIHNAIRHGGATRIDIDYADYTLEIADNGRGLRGRRVVPGFGLRNIGNRLAPFGGCASLEARAGLTGETGCKLTLSLNRSAAA